MGATLLRQPPYTSVMPKLLVLFEGADEDVVKVAAAIQKGARSVRFAECDIRRIAAETDDGGAARIRALDGPATLAEYDAIALGGPAGGTPLLAALLDDAGELGLTGRLANKLGAVFPVEPPDLVGDRHPLWPLLAPMARYGMILVPPGYAGPSGGSEDHASAARRLGKRLVDIAAWITHARSHAH